MFEQTFITSRETARGPWPVAASLALQSAFVAAVLAVPLFQTVKLAWKPIAPITFIPVKAKVVEVVQEQAATKEVVNLAPATRRRITLPQPAARHTTVVAESGIEPVPGLLADSGGGYADPLAQIGSAAVASEIAVKKSAAATATAKPSMLKVGTGVQAAKLIHQVKPAYPPLARAARISGTVRLQAIIAADGRIRNLQLLGGPPLLVAAALEAVKQWQYAPTLLNGDAVEVITSIEVNFILGQ
jgi:protein TonB